MSSVLPGGSIGVLGGGQLGRMLAMEGRRMGYRVGVLDSVAGCPAGQVADYVVQSAFTNLPYVLDFIAQVDVVTVETELVPWEILAEIEKGKATRPSSFVLALVQDRLVQRQFLQEQGFPQTSFASIKEKSDFVDAVQHVRFPAILKTRRSGYDGKGQARVASEKQLHDAWKKLGEVPAVLETVVPFKRELSVVLARSLQGEIRAYPLAENVHRQNILHTTSVPAQVTDLVRARAEELAISLAEVLGYCGIMAVEIFLLEDDSLLINEIAPRPHNSGHFTFGACVTSQFEQHLRAICGLPLGDSTLLCPVLMMNLLGDLWQNGSPNWDSLLAHPRVRLHLYGKDHAKPGRKMGHFLLLEPNLDLLLNEAEVLLGSLTQGKAGSHGRTIEHSVEMKSPSPHAASKRSQSNELAGVKNAALSSSPFWGDSFLQGRHDISQQFGEFQS